MMLSLGAVSARLVWSGGFGWFLQQRMKWPLLIAALVLLALGVSETWSAWREESRNPESGRRSSGPTVGWLLALPLLVLYSVAPTGLGAAAADRVEAYTPTELSVRYDPLPPSTDGPLEMRVFEFLDRAIWDPDQTLEGRTVRLEGLVVNDESVPGGFKLTRFMVSCCAADGVPLQVDLHGAPEPLANDTWVEVDVQWRPPETPYQDSPAPWTVEADIVSLTVVPEAPSDAYESPY